MINNRHGNPAAPNDVLVRSFETVQRACLTETSVEALKGVIETELGAVITDLLYRDPMGPEERFLWAQASAHLANPTLAAAGRGVRSIEICCKERQHQPLGLLHWFTDSDGQTQIIPNRLLREGTKTLLPVRFRVFPAGLERLRTSSGLLAASPSSMLDTAAHLLDHGAATVSQTPIGTGTEAKVVFRCGMCPSREHFRFDCDSQKLRRVLTRIDESRAAQMPFPRVSATD